MRKLTATGVAFKRSGKIYDFTSEGNTARRGDFVVVETEKGEDIAVVILPEREISVSDQQEMKKIVRVATEEDVRMAAENRKDEPKAFEVCKRFVTKHELDMKLLSAEYTLDRSKLTFYFTADGRIDFRALVRDLARVFRTRIEMRQIGVRDATKMIGGFGICGREFCCSSFLRKFDNISIKMAKDQNLILNPSKISGVCGRLMCCLMYEKEGYGDGESSGKAEDFIVLKEDGRSGGAI